MAELISASSNIIGRLISSEEPAPAGVLCRLTRLQSNCVEAAGASNLPARFPLTSPYQPYQRKFREVHQ
jgi:hypothetical protein